ncbi:phosphomannomutase/phosphoglucomutase [Luteibacter anthropi]|uniref:phosphomannomutase/phosphoglucomutase n=1 Tax=Luteibacter anthropi TaxID=564369 RepID=UPI0020325292|nr:phosphomannomutase/phosphoglucomutase [Luteibacter anthropi]URX63575.1 phosphomannomutase/phosphoglucomutase [Luteibacter anthropi]
MARITGGVGRRLRIDLRRTLPLAGATLFIVLGFFCAWQTWLIADKESAAERTHAAQREAVQAIAGVVNGYQGAFRKAIGDPALAVILDDHPAVAARLRLAMPDARAVDVYSSGLDEVVHADYRTFGYAKAAQLMSALGTETAVPASTLLVNGQRRMSLVEPIGDIRDPRAWIWLEFPFDAITQHFEAVSPAGGRLELHQGDNAAPLLTRGSRAAELEATGMPVPGTMFSVMAAMPRAFIVLPDSVVVAGVLTLLCLGGGGFLAWRRNHLPPPVDDEPKPDILVADVVRKPRLPPAAAPALAHAADEVVSDIPKLTASPVDASIFRAYDIRGVVGRSLGTDTARQIGGAIGSLMREHGLHEIVIGRDGRTSGPELAHALSDGLRSAGIDVIDIGAAPTPVVYFAAFHFGTGCAVAVTGSHNPASHNGFKIVVGGETLSGDAITDLRRRIEEGQLPVDGHGSLREVSATDAYVSRVVGDVSAGRRLKVVVDAGNGIAGAVAPRVLEDIGCEVMPLYCDVDGTFPNHHPDPSDAHNLADLIAAVRTTGADLGIAFDGDGDRLGVVTHEGEIVPADRLLMLFAQDVLLRNPGATVVYDVKCSAHLRPVIQEAAGVPLMWRTGHSMIKAKMRETGAALGGEMSGHFFFADGNRWYGFDDGVYAAARLLEILAGDPEERGLSALVAEFPHGMSTPELRLAMEEGASARFMAAFRDIPFDDARVTTLDGVRVDWADGWGLVRASHTEEALVFRFEANDGKAFERIRDAFRQHIHAVDSGISLPF